MKLSQARIEPTPNYCQSSAQPNYAILTHDNDRKSYQNNNFPKSQFGLVILFTISDRNS